MSYYDPNQNPRGTTGGPAGGSGNYGQGGGQDFGQQPYDDEETVGGYQQPSGYPNQGYTQGYPAQGSYSQPVAGGQAGQLNNQGYQQQYADANAPVLVRAGTTGRNWLPYLVVGIVLVALVCCVLPGAILLRNNNFFGPTAQATPAVGSTVYTNPLTSLPGDNRWPATTTCGFQPGGYTVTANNTCIATLSNIPNNLSVSVKVTQTVGPTDAPHGIALRRTSAGNYYVFGITSSGSWVFIKYAENKTPATLVTFKTNTAIKTGLNAANTIEVRASGSNFYFFANGTSLGQVSDNSYTGGLVGLTGDSGATVVYSNITIANLA